LELRQIIGEVDNPGDNEAEEWDEFWWGMKWEKHERPRRKEEVLWGRLKEREKDREREWNWYKKKEEISG
jgi:hypothetical protein